MLETRTLSINGSVFADWSPISTEQVESSPKLVAVRDVLRMSPLSVSLRVTYDDNSATEYRYPR